MSGRVEGTEKEVPSKRRLTVTVDRDTQDYNRANADLEWHERLLARNWLTIIYAFVPSIPSVILFMGVKAVVNVLASEDACEPGVRMSVWAAVVTIAFEVSTIVMRFDTTFIRKRPAYWLILIAIWLASLVMTGSNLGMWGFGVFWLGWWLAFLMDDMLLLG